MWSAPELPPFININRHSPPGLNGGLQPGDLSMGAAATEFLKLPDDEKRASRSSLLPGTRVPLLRSAVP